jgi:hypothetical protein
LGENHPYITMIVCSFVEMVNSQVQKDINWFIISSLKNEWINIGIKRIEEINWAHKQNVTKFCRNLFIMEKVLLLIKAVYIH